MSPLHKYMRPQYHGLKTTATPKFLEACQQRTEPAPYPMPRNGQATTRIALAEALASCDRYQKVSGQERKKRKHGVEQKP